MRGISAVFSLVSFLALFSVPFLANAAPTPACSGGTLDDPAGTRVFKVETGVADKIKSHLRTVACANACFDETIKFTVSSDFSITIKVETKNECKKTSTDPKGLDANAPENNRGCKANQRRPFATLISPEIKINLGIVALDMPSRKIERKDRCDASLLKYGDSFVDNVTGGNGLPTQEKLENVLNDLENKTQTVPTTVIDTRVSQPLENAFGIEVAQKVANSGNSAEAEAAFKRADEVALRNVFERSGVEINDDLRSKMARLAPQYDEKPSESGETDRLLLDDNTFKRDEAQRATIDMDRAKCAISTIESGSCSGNYGTIGPATRTGNRAFGKYQVMDFNVPSWTWDACGRSMDPREFLARPDCQEAVFEKRFGSYVSSCGSYEGAAARWFTGRCNPPASANDMYTSVGKYLQKFSSVFSGGALPFGSVASVYSRPGSPFAYSTPFYGSESYTSAPEYYGDSSGEEIPRYQSGARYGQQVYCMTSFSPLMLYPIPAGTPFPSNCYNASGIAATPQAGIPGLSQPLTPQQAQQQPPPSQPVSSQLLKNLQSSTNIYGGGAPAPVDPVAAFVVQPKSVTLGNPIIVSWSSVGMSPITPCAVFMELGGANSLVGQGNEGTRRVSTGATTTQGVWNFTLQCTAGSTGEMIRATSTVSVQ